MDGAIGRRAVGAVRVAGLIGLIGLVVWVRVVVVVEVDVWSDPTMLVYGVLAPAAYLVPGVILLLRRRWHIVGWLLCAAAVAMAFSFGGDWGRLRFGGPWMRWALDLFEGSLFWLPFVTLLVVFPDGLADRPRRQRVTGIVVIVVAVLATLAEMFVSQIGVEGVPTVASPVPFAFVPQEVANTTIFATFAALVVAFWGMVWRYRSSTAAARRQYRWVLAAIVFVLLALVTGITGSALGGYDNGPWWLPIMAGYVFVPIAFMVAILRYRLYDIDRLITRTVSYSIVIVLLGALYLVAVTLLSSVMPGNNDLAVAASTLTAAAVVRPVHRVVQVGVQRRFNRTRFDAEREAHGFGRRMQDQTDLRVVEAELRTVIDRTLRPSTSDIWIRR